MSKPAPPPVHVVYFQDHRDHRYHELLGDTPARLKNGTLLLLKDAPEAEDVEVHMGSGWLEGWVCGKPTEYKFVVSCVSWRSERDVWNVIEAAMRETIAEFDTPIPWVKVIPPSKQVHQIEGETVFVVIAREDRGPNGEPGRYTLATRAVFETEDAAKDYASGIAPSREPMVIPGRFNQLRSPK